MDKVKKKINDELSLDVCFRRIKYEALEVINHVFCFNYNRKLNSLSKISKFKCKHN